MADDNLFKTGRMNVLRGANLMFMPGQIVYLQRRVHEFARGTQVKVISVQAVRPGEYRYQILVDEKKMWAFESDLRHTAPNESGTGPQDLISGTQRMQTLTLSQRMSALVAAPLRPNAATMPSGATQRMHNSTQEERLQKMLQTNRLRTLGVSGSNSVLGPETVTPADAPATPPPDKKP